MRISVDAGQCTGHGRCYTVSPEVFAPDDDGFCADRGGTREVPAGFEAAVVAGAQACPERAITIMSAEGGAMSPVTTSLAGAAGLPAAGQPVPPVSQEELRRLIDRQQICEVLYRYASSVDYKDFATLRSLFTDDAHGVYMTVADLTGADEIVKWIDGMTADKSWQHHKLTVYHVDFTGPDEASALTYHTSHQTDVGDDSTVTLIVARYRDKLRRVGGTWKITEKIMEPGWMEQRRLPSPDAS
jgi:ferredoxin